MKKYYVDYGRINLVEMLAETDKTITIQLGGRNQWRLRLRKSTGATKMLFDTWQAAKDYLITRAELMVSVREEELERAKGNLTALHEMKEPIE